MDCSYDPQKFSGFDKKREIIDSFHTLFNSAQEIPHWLISYNNRSYPKIEDFTAIISKYKEVNIEAKTYLNGRGGKGSVAGSQEILFICKNRKLYNIHFSQYMISYPFSYWQNLYDSDKMEEFNFNPSGLLWLKIKSIKRKELIIDFLKIANIQLKENKLDKQFVEIYELLVLDSASSLQIIDSFIFVSHGYYLF